MVWKLSLQVSALEAIEKQDLLMFYEQKIASQGLDRRKLSIQIYSSQHALELQTAQSQSEDSNGSVTEVSRKFHITTFEDSNSRAIPDEVVDVCPSRSQKSIRIKDIQTFKLSQSLYGAPTGLAAFLAPQNQNYLHKIPVSISWHTHGIHKIHVKLGSQSTLVASCDLLNVCGSIETHKVEK